MELENIINYGDFLFNTRNTLELVGKGATWTGVNGQYAFNSNIARFKFDGIDTIFFNYLYNTQQMLSQVHARAVGTTSVAAIYPRDLNSLLYYIPKLEEQQKIGSFLKQLDNLITQNEHKLDLLKQLKQAYLQQIFSQELRFAGFIDTWEQRKIEELGDVVRTGINPQNYLKEQFAEYSMPAYDDGQRPQIVLGSSMQSSRLTISGSVLLINKLNVRQKRVWLVSNPLENSVASGEFMPFTSSNVDLSFMRQLILSDKTTRDFEAMSSGTSNSQKRITPTDFLNYVISVPASKIEQTRIGGIFDEMDKLITLHQKKLNLLKQQKQAYLQKMFI
ncbi:restriction endonuclease subunit S [Leuconostoc pseudomesenteroides]|uniref:restriction endonuclease subunit S n=1 Tax=Leuconostoc pseudomesenteroides TaxID=33968 RepID=UPI00403D6077